MEDGPEDALAEAVVGLAEHLDVDPHGDAVELGEQALDLRSALLRDPGFGTAVYRLGVIYIY